MQKYLVVDTNIILLDVNNLVTLSKSYPDHQICIPETVVEELDSKKTSLGEIGYQARSFGRLMAKGVKGQVLIKDTLLEPSLRLFPYICDGLELSIVTMDSYTNNSSSPKLDNDNRIIEVAKNLGALLISNDVMCRIRAEMSGVQTSDLKHVDDINLEFLKPMLVEPRIFKELHNTPILDLDPLHLPENFCYIFSSIDTGETKLATIHNGTVKVLGRDTEQQIRQQEVNPINKEQLLFSALAQDPQTDITLCESVAGSGKTIIALSNAMKLIDENPLYDSIIYIRNTVDDLGSDDEAIGFLSGNDEKMQVYLHPFYDTVSSIVRMRYSSIKKHKDLEEQISNEIDNVIAEYNMTPIVALGLRGRTFNNAIIIVDEAQNISKATMQKILSRVGKHTKVFILGSLRQIDSKYLTKYTSGLSVLLDATKRTDLPIKLNAITLTKVVRGRITEFAERVFSNF